MTFTYGSVEEEKTDRHEVLTDQYSERAAVINILSLFTGTGMLSLPYAAARAGWLGGILILAAVQNKLLVYEMKYDNSMKGPDTSEINDNSETLLRKKCKLKSRLDLIVDYKLCE